MAQYASMPAPSGPPGDGPTQGEPMALAELEELRPPLRPTAGPSEPVVILQHGEGVMLGGNLITRECNWIVYDRATHKDIYTIPHDPSVNVTFGTIGTPDNRLVVHSDGILRRPDEQRYFRTEVTLHPGDDIRPRFTFTPGKESEAAYVVVRRNGDEEVFKIPPDGHNYAASRYLDIKYSGAGN